MDKKPKETIPIIPDWIFEKVEELNATTGQHCLYIRLKDWEKFKEKYAKRK